MKTTYYPKGTNTCTLCSVYHLPQRLAPWESLLSGCLLSSEADLRELVTDSCGGCVLLHIGMGQSQAPKKVESSFCVQQESSRVLSAGRGAWMDRVCLWDSAWSLCHHPLLLTGPLFFWSCQPFQLGHRLSLLATWSISELVYYLTPRGKSYFQATNSLRILS